MEISYSDFDNINELLDTASLAIDALDLENQEDKDIIKTLLDCCDEYMSSTLLFERREKSPTPSYQLEPFEDVVILSSPKTTNRRKLENEHLTTESLHLLINELQTDETSFLSRMRMNKKMFDMIHSAIYKDIKRQDTLMRESVLPAEKLLVTLRFLATGDSYKAMSKQANLSQAFLSHSIPEVCRAIMKNLKDEYLKFPSTPAEWEQIADEFDDKWQFPLCLGALDGKHIFFKPLRKDPNFYYNYNKGAHSFILLGLVDSNCRFSYIDVGCVHEDGVLLQDSLRSFLKNVSTTFPPDKIIGNERILPFVFVANSTYPLTQHIMTPYTDGGVGQEKHTYNLRTTWPILLVEKAFTLLESRFGILQTKCNLSIQTVELIAKTCCLLHNFILVNNTETLTIYSPSMNNWKSIPVEKTAGDYDCEAESTRQGFTEYFYEEGSVDYIETDLNEPFQCETISN